MIKSKKLVIVGAGEFAELAYEYFTHDSSYEVIGFSVESQYIKSASLFGLAVTPFEELESIFPPETTDLFVAITFTQLNRVRTRLYHAAKNKGYKLASYVSSRAFVWHNVIIGENSFIFENNVIQYHVSIGNNVILWSGNHLGHRTSIANNCFLSSHVVVSGYCKIGANCFFGVNSTLVDHVQVGEDCFIAAGALLIRNAEPGKIYKGNPAVASKVTAFQYFKIAEPEMM